MDTSQVNRAIKVGADERILTICQNQFPRSERTLYLLTTLDDKGFKKLAKPETTVQDVLDYKATVEAPKAEPTRGRPRKSKDTPKAKPPGYLAWAVEYGLLKPNTGSLTRSKARAEIEEIVGFEIGGSKILNKEESLAVQDACIRLAAAKGINTVEGPDVSLLKRDKFQTAVLVEAERRFRDYKPPEESELVKDLREQVERAKEMSSHWSYRVSKCKAMLVAFEENWRTISVSVHPDRPERTREQLEKATVALNKIKALADQIDIKSL